MSDNILSDAIFPVGALLRKVASGDILSDPVGKDNSASQSANRRAAANPSGINMQTEAAKAAQRAGVGRKPAARPAATQAPSAPAAPAASAGRDHYEPRFTGKISNND